MKHRTDSLLSIFVVALMLFGATVVNAQKFPSKALASVNEERARNIVGFLADDLLEGRDAGKRGGALAANYIVSLLQEWGVRPLMESGYYQPFQAVRNGNNWLTEADRNLSQLVADGCEVRDLRNILAVIPGNEPGIVVVGAHYDHLGIDASLKGDSCFNGADDNASGVSAVLQIARAVKTMRKTPERGIIFAFWDGEEKGLLGSRHFVENCAFLSQVSAYMNFDMIGRGPVDNPKHLTYFYTASYPAFGDWLKADMAVRGFSFLPDYRAWDNPTGGSDNAWFAKNGIPIVWYHTEGHPDYHRPSDTADRIDYEKLVDITRAAFLCTWRLANEKY